MKQLIDTLLELITAFIIGAGGALSAALIASNGTFDKKTIWAIVSTGLLTMSKDYRSLKKLPMPNGNTTFITKDTTLITKEQTEPPKNA